MQLIISKNCRILSYPNDANYKEDIEEPLFQGSKDLIALVLSQKD